MIAIWLDRAKAARLVGHVGPQVPAYLEELLKFPSVTWGHGVFISDAQMSQRLNCSPRTAERCRQDAVRVGLLRATARPGTSWIVEPGLSQAGSFSPIWENVDSNAGSNASGRISSVKSVSRDTRPLPKLAALPLPKMATESVPILSLSQNLSEGTADAAQSDLPSARKMLFDIVRRVDEKQAALLAKVLRSGNVSDHDLLMTLTDDFPSPITTGEHLREVLTGYLPTG
jgi:hypothetical protein